MTTDYCINLNSLKPGDTFRFFKNKTLERSIDDNEIYMKLYSSDTSFKYVQLSGDCGIVKRHGPQVGYNVDTKIKSKDLDKTDIKPLGSVEYGEVISMYLGDNVFDKRFFMIGQDPIEKKFFNQLADLENEHVQILAMAMNQILNLIDTEDIGEEPLEINPKPVAVAQNPTLKEALT